MSKIKKVPGQKLQNYRHLVQLPNIMDPATHRLYLATTPLRNVDVYTYDNGKGLLTFNKFENGIEVVAVAPEHEGKGIASALVNFAKTLTKEPIVMHCHPDNTIALEIYKSAGFVQTGQTENMLKLMYYPDQQLAPVPHVPQ